MEGVPPPAPLARLVRVFTRPGSAFVGLSAQPYAWALPLLVLAVLTWLPVQVPALREMQIDRQRSQVAEFVAGGLLPAESEAEMLARLDEQRTLGAGARLAQLGLGAGGLLILRLMLPALLLMLGARFVMEGRVRYLAVLNVLAYSALPAGVREVARAGLQLLRGNLDVYFSPAALTGTRSVGGYALNQLDLFDIWILGLVIIGLAEVGGIDRRKSAGLVLPLWLIYALLKIAYRSTPFGAAV